MARAQRKILITAGPTREMLDPVRFLSNLSTGEMGYALARAARRRGYRVTLVSGPTALKPPKGVLFVPVVSAAQMQKACARYFPAQDGLIMTAAVCDFTAGQASSQKLKRTQTKKFLLKQTPDIVKGLAARKGGRTVIGFCLETQNWLGNALNKVRRKQLDGIVANYYRPGHVPFGRRRINTAFVGPAGTVKLLRRVSKEQIAAKLLDWLETLSRPAVNAKN